MFVVTLYVIYNVIYNTEKNSCKIVYTCTQQALCTFMIIDVFLSSFVFNCCIYNRGKTEADGDDGVAGPGAYQAHQ